MNAVARVVAIALLVLLTVSPAVAADDAVWAALQRGTHVILIRHAQTTPGAGDPPGFKLGDCTTQRNLSDDGRAQARRLGQVFRARRIEIGRVLSSPWCRCIETAELAFGRKPQVSQTLANIFGRPEAREGHIAELRKLVSDYRGPGNLVLVTHGASISALIGVSVGMGAIVVVRPEGNGRFAVLGQADAQ